MNFTSACYEFEIRTYIALSGRNQMFKTFLIIIIYVYFN